MKEFEKAKNEYFAITASEELKRKVEKTMKQNKKKRAWKTAALAAAGVLIVSIGAVNVSPSLAYAVSDVPILGSVVRVVTFDRYEYKDHGYEANIVTPQIEGLLDEDLEDKLNNEFKENAAAVIAAYEADVKELKAEFPDEDVHMSIMSDYTVKTDNDDILALDVYIYTASGSSSTIHHFYNIDKKTGQLLTLPGLFKDDADYVSVISEYITSEMKRLNAEENGMFFIDGEEENFEGFKEIKPDQNFYINDQGNIVICFDKYEVAAGAQGSPEFEIPNDLIADLRK